MKKSLISLVFASSLLFSGCARIPVVGNIYTEIRGKPGIGSYQYLEDGKRTFVFTFDQFKYYYVGRNKHLDLYALNLDLMNEVKISEGNYSTIASNNFTKGFTFGSGYTEKNSFLEVKIGIDEKLVKSKGFNYYYFKIGDNVITAGQFN